MAKLTDVALRAKLLALAKEGPAKPVRIAAGDGLYLLVKAAARPAPDAEVKPRSGSWVLRYTWAGRRRDMGLGNYPTVGMGEARGNAAEALRLLRAGTDPVTARKDAKEAYAAAEREAAARATTFRQAAEATIDARAAGWRSPKHAGQWMATLKAHAYPLIGDMPVTDVDRDAVLQVLNPIWAKTPETASRVRGRIEAVLDFATVKGWRQGPNPAGWKGHLALLLPPPRKVAPVEHHPSLPWAQMPGFMAALAEREGMAALALRFSILTAARTGEVRGMRWSEVDMDGGVWTVPAGRMKAARQHRVPLCGPALELLRGLLPPDDADEPTHDALVFPGGRVGSPLSDMALSMLVRGMACDGLKEGELPRWRDAEGRAVVPHGFRAAFKGWSLAAGFPDPLSELALAHADKSKVRAAYAREDMLEQRRPMMDAWAAHCGRQPAEVLSIGAVRTRRTTA